MGSLLHVRPAESRVPETEVLRDGRKRLTRFFEAGPGRSIPAELNLAVATEDFFDTAPEGWAGLLLTDKKLTDELPQKGVKDSRPIVQLIFEQISPTAETQVGGRTERKLADGRVGYELNYLQYSTNAFVPGTPGTDTDPNDASAFLLEVEGPDDGTLRQIKRTYVYAGELSTATQTKNNGALSLITTTWAKTVPPTPGGYILIGTPTQNPNGLPIYTYTFAKGNGEISSQTEFIMSPDGGVTGLTATTIEYLSDPSVVVNPITPPGSSIQITSSSKAMDGYTLWTAAFVAGAGVVNAIVETRYNGELVIYTTVGINAAPSTPGSTIGGTVTLIKKDQRNGSWHENGVIIYEYTWAEGKGVISSDTETKNGGKLILYRTTSLGVAPSTPGSTIGGTVALVDAEQRNQDGYVLYEYRWAEGEGLIDQDTEWLQSPDQGTNGVTRITDRYLASLTSTQLPTSESGAALIRSAHQDVDGYRIWTTVWGKGAGLVLDESTVVKIGALVVHNRVGLGSAPSAPSASIGGTLVLIESGTRNAEGYAIYDYRWSEGNGQCKIATRGQENGALLYEVVVAAFTAGTPAYPGSGTAYLTGLEQEAMNGYYLNTATYHKPPASQTYNDTIDWPQPGQVQPTSPDPGYVVVPGNEHMPILAEVTVDYGTSQIDDVPWAVSNWVGFSETYVVPSNGQTVTRQWGMGGYLSNGFVLSGAAGTYNGIAVSSYSLTVLASSPGAPPSGPTTIRTRNRPYLVDLSGTVVYERTKTTYTF